MFDVIVSVQGSFSETLTWSRLGLKGSNTCWRDHRRG